MDGGMETAECKRILSQSSDGDHKAAVDAYQTWVDDGGSCGETVQDAVLLSTTKLEEADSLVSRAFREINEGDLLKAKTSLNQALEVYPRYYWVSKLLRDLDRSMRLRAEGLQQEARYLQTQGDLAGALNRMRQAGDLLPEGELSGEISRLEVMIEGRAKRERAWNELARAREFVDQNRFLDAERVLEGGEARSAIPENVSSFLEELRAKRQLRGREAFRDARASEVAGDLDRAFFHIGSALDLGELDEPLRSEIIEFARLLGMKYYSQGRLTQAREVWSLALANDSGNAKLEEYLHEVQERLKSLRKIQEQDGDERSERP
ncbi:MAG: hypothetical protein JSV26_11850 [bacterium]|nr:MAG: hypothetical protein JSV26_11850 [bacterium]